MKLGGILGKALLLGLSALTLLSAWVAGYVVMPWLQSYGIVSVAITVATQTLANYAIALVGIAVVAMVVTYIFRAAKLW